MGNPIGTTNSQYERWSGYAVRENYRAQPCSGMKAGTSRTCFLLLCESLSTRIGSESRSLLSTTWESGLARHLQTPAQIRQTHQYLDVSGEVPNTENPVQAARSLCRNRRKPGNRTMGAKRRRQCSGQQAAADQFESERLSLRVNAVPRFRWGFASKFVLFRLV